MLVLLFMVKIKKMKDQAITRAIIAAEIGANLI
jgi:hypothetical protein